MPWEIFLPLFAVLCTGGFLAGRFMGRKAADMEKQLDEAQQLTADSTITGAVKRETHRLRRREHLKNLAYKNGWGLLELEAFAKDQFGSPGGLTWSLGCYSDSQIEQLIAAFEADE